MDSSTKNKTQDMDASEDSPLSPESIPSENSARTTIIEVARKLFADQGLEGTSTRDIAREAGLNVSLISYYFGGKEGLYKAVIQEYAMLAASRMDELLATLDLENLSREGFKKTMRSLVQKIIEMKFGEPYINTILQRELMSGLPHAEKIFEETFVQILVRIVGLYQQGQKKGFVRPDINPYVVFLSMVHSADAYVNMGQCKTSMSCHVPQIPSEMDEYIEQIYKIFIEGVMT